MEVLEEAKALIARDPLPPDAFEQLQALEARAPEAERWKFAALFEALFVRQNGQAKQ